MHHCIGRQPGPLTYRRVPPRLPLRRVEHRGGEAEHELWAANGADDAKRAQTRVRKSLKRLSDLEIGLTDWKSFKII